MTARVISITDHSATLRRQFHQSVDLLDLGETLCDTGSQVASAGRHIMQLNELPTEHMLTEIEFCGMALVRMANCLRLASAAPIAEGIDG